MRISSEVVDGLYEKHGERHECGICTLSKTIVVQQYRCNQDTATRSCMMERRRDGLLAKERRQRARQKCWQVRWDMQMRRHGVRAIRKRRDMDAGEWSGDGGEERDWGA